jgi:hypothetical protein
MIRVVGKMTFRSGQLYRLCITLTLTAVLFSCTSPHEESASPEVVLPEPMTHEQAADLLRNPPQTLESRCITGTTPDGTALFASPRRASEAKIQFEVQKLIVVGDVHQMPVGDFYGDADDATKAMKDKGITEFHLCPRPGDL